MGARKQVKVSNRANKKKRKDNRSERDATSISEEQETEKMTDIAAKTVANDEIEGKINEETKLDTQDSKNETRLNILDNIKSYDQVEIEVEPAEVALTKKDTVNPDNETTESALYDSKDANEKRIKPHLNKLIDLVTKGVLDRIAADETILQINSGLETHKNTEKTEDNIHKDQVGTPTEENLDSETLNNKGNLGPDTKNKKEQVDTVVMAKAERKDTNRKNLDLNAQEALTTCDNIPELSNSFSQVRKLTEENLDNETLHNKGNLGPDTKNEKEQVDTVVMVKTERKDTNRKNPDLNAQEALTTCDNIPELSNSVSDVATTEEIDIKLNKTLVNSLVGNKLHMERQIEAELKEQKDHTRTKILNLKEEDEGTTSLNAEFQIESNHEKVGESSVGLPQLVGRNRCYQNSSIDQILGEYLRDIFKPLIVETVENVLLSSSQSNKSLKEEPVLLAADLSNNINETSSSETHAVKQELSEYQTKSCNFESKREINTNQELYDTPEDNTTLSGESNDHNKISANKVFNDKEVQNLILEIERDPTEQPKPQEVEPKTPSTERGVQKDQIGLQDAADTGEIDGNLKLQNKRVIEPQEQKESENINPDYSDLVEGIKVLTVQSGSNIAIKADKFKDKRHDHKECGEYESLDDGKVSENQKFNDKNECNKEKVSQETKLENLAQELEDTEEIYAAIFQRFMRTLIPQLKKNLQMSYHRNNLQEHNATDIDIDPFKDFERPLTPRKDIPNFESTRIEHSDLEDREEDKVLMDLTGILKEEAVKEKTIDNEFKEERRPNDEIDEDDKVLDVNHGGETFLEPLRFHSVHGDNIWLSKNNFRAQRKKKSNFFSKGIAFSSRPVAIGEKVCLHLKQLSRYWLGLITIGFTTNDPSSIAGNLPSNVISEGDGGAGYWAEHLDKKYYQDSCKLHYYLNSSGNMCFGTSGVDQVEYLWKLKITKPVWALIDVFGYFTVVEFDMPKELRNSSIMENLSLLTENSTESKALSNNSWIDTQINQSCLNYQLRFVPFDLYKQIEGSGIKFLTVQGICVTSNDKGGCINAKLPLFPGQIIIVQNLTVGKALFYIGVKFFSAKTTATSLSPALVKLNVIMHKNDELALTLTESGEVRVTKNLDVPNTILKVSRTQELWPFVRIFRRNQVIKIWTNNIPSLIK